MNTEIFQKAKATVIVWRIAIVRGILYSLMLMGAAWLTALNKLSWSDLSWDDKRNILIGIFVTWANGMIMFLDKTAGQIVHGQIPGVDDTKPPFP